MDRTEEQQAAIDKKDYIDIMAFLRAFFRYTRRYWVFALALNIFMTACVTGGMLVVSKKLLKNTYTATGSFTIGLLLSDSLEYNYVLSGLGWNKVSILGVATNSTVSLMGSDYMEQIIREKLGIDPDDELNGEISTQVQNLTNLVTISVTSDSKEDAESIRDTIFECFEDAIFPIMGYIELNINNMATEENESSYGFLENPIVWVAIGVILGTFMYLGLLFAYALFFSNLETPEDVSDITPIPCLVQLPVRKKKSNDYKRALVHLRRRVAEETGKRGAKILLITGVNNKKAQSAIAQLLESELREQGMNVVLTNFDDDVESLTAESVQKTLDELLKEAEFVLIDGPLCGSSAAPLILADRSDAVMFRIEQGNARPQTVKDMLQSLRYARAESIGYVLDRCDYIKQ